MKFDLKKVLILDGINPLCEKVLRDGGIDATSKGKLTKDELLEELKVHDAVIVRSATKVTSEILEKSNLKVVGRAGTGVDNIDITAATKKGVLVMNTPGGNTLSAAEHTCAMICALSREIPDACASLKEGRWDRKKYMGNELNGKTLAIVGLGKIGQEVASRMQSFNMTTIGFDPIVSKEAAAAFGVESLALEDLWPRADYITVHTPLIPQTRNLVGDKALKACKDGVRVVNVARGGIVDESALLNAIVAGTVKGAALDVFETEPPTNMELIKHPKVICTPHLGANTHEAQLRVAVEIAEQFVQMSRGGEIVGAVNGMQLFKARDSPQGWDKLATAFGKLAAAFGADSLSISGKIIGPLSKSIRPVLKTSIEIGFLSQRNISNANLINCSALAQEVGLTYKDEILESDGQTGSHFHITFSGENNEEMKLKGTVKAGDPFLTAIGENTFSNGVLLSGNLYFIPSATLVDLNQFLTSIHSIYVSSNCPKWIIVNVNDEAGFDKRIPNKLFSLKF